MHSLLKAAGSGMVELAYLRPLPNSRSYWQLKFGHGGRIYTVEIGKCYNSVLRKPLIKHLPAPTGYRIIFSFLNNCLTMWNSRVEFSFQISSFTAVLFISRYFLSIPLTNGVTEQITYAFCVLVSLSVGEG